MRTLGRWRVRERSRGARGRKVWWWRGLVRVRGHSLIKMKLLRCGFVGGYASSLYLSSDLNEKFRQIALGGDSLKYRRLRCCFR